MTLNDMINWKGNIALQELETLLYRKAKIERKISRLSSERDFAEDALALFTPNEDKYEYFQNKLEDINDKAAKLAQDLLDVEQQIMEA